MDKHNIVVAVMGDNSSECYVYQTRCQPITNFIENFTGRIQRYHNGILHSQTILNSNDCISYNLLKIVYSKNKLFMLFHQTILVVNVTSWEQLFYQDYTYLYIQNYIDISISSNYLTFNNGPIIYVVSLKNWAVTCTFNNTQLITSIKTVQSYTFFTTLTKLVQFDNDVCEIIDQFQLPTTDIQHLVQYSQLTKQLILYRPQTCQYVQSNWSCFGSTFLYLYSFDYAYLSNSRSCLPTYGYLAGRCIKNYGRSQPPPRPPPPKQIIPISNISTAESTPPTSTLQTMIIPTATLLVSVLVSYLAYLLIFHCFKFYKIKEKEKENQKWWETINKQKDKNHQP